MFNIINEVNYAYAIIKFKASKVQVFILGPTRFWELAIDEL